jgi:hypothetical protein
MQSLPLFADGLDHYVDVRVRLIRMQGHSVPMLERELLTTEILYGCEDLVG